MPEQDANNINKANGPTPSKGGIRRWFSCFLKLPRKLDEQNAKINELTQRTEELASENAKLNKLNSELTEDNAALREYITSVDKLSGSLSARLDSDETTIVAISQRMDLSENTIKERQDASENVFRERLDASDATIHAISDRMDDMDNRYGARIDSAENRENAIQALAEANRKDIIGVSEHLGSTESSLKADISTIHTDVEKINGDISVSNEQISVTKENMRLIQDNLYTDDGLSELRSKLTQVPAFWGKRGRLHCSSNTAVFTCMFNTNSGDIYIGDYTFAGSNVSILAGTHNMRFTDVVRRELTPENGCDIHIGKGVWLCSNSVILGPCTIGDNSVIAAGSVVVPGTTVEPNSVYGGVPAKKIKSLDGELLLPDEDSLLTVDNLPEEGNVRFAFNWHGADQIVFSDGTKVSGQWMSSNKSTALLIGNDEPLKLRVYCPVAVKKNFVFKLSFKGEEYTYEFTSDELTIELDKISKGRLAEINFEISETWTPKDEFGSSDFRKLGAFVGY